MNKQAADLRKRLKDLEKQMRSLEKALDVHPEHGLGKGDPAVTQWELDQALLKQLRSRADRLRKALTRMEEGSYGICEQCGEPIHPDRLAVLPDTKVCIECARKDKS